MVLLLVLTYLFNFFYLDRDTRRNVGDKHLNWNTHTNAVHREVVPKEEQVQDGLLT